MSAVSGFVAKRSAGPKSPGWANSPKIGLQGEVSPAGNKRIMGLVGYVGCHKGVSKNKGTPKMDGLMENPIKMDDLGDTIIFGNFPYLDVPGI